MNFENSKVDIAICTSILNYMENYPTFLFRSTRLSRIFNITPQKLSKILLDLHKEGYLERTVMGCGKKTRSYYKIVKNYSWK
jgi:DNA-binding IscR family transcriptional regulator